MPFFISKYSKIPKFKQCYFSNIEIYMLKIAILAKNYIFYLLKISTMTFLIKNSEILSCTGTNVWASLFLPKVVLTLVIILLKFLVQFHHILILVTCDKWPHHVQLPIGKAQLPIVGHIRPIGWCGKMWIATT